MHLIWKQQNNNFALGLIIAFTGNQSFNGQYMYLFTQQLYIINKTDKTLITCLLIFLFSIYNYHFNDIWHFVDWINFIGIAWFLSMYFIYL